MLSVANGVTKLLKKIFIEGNRTILHALQLFCKWTNKNSGTFFRYFSVDIIFLNKWIYVTHLLEQKTYVSRITQARPNKTKTAHFLHFKSAVGHYIWMLWAVSLPIVGGPKASLWSSNKFEFVGLTPAMGESNHCHSVSCAFFWLLRTLPWLLTTVPNRKLLQILFEGPYVKKLPTFFKNRIPYFFLTSPAQ